jgi:hypothetical protein
MQNDKSKFTIEITLIHKITLILYYRVQRERMKRLLLTY